MKGDAHNCLEFDLALADKTVIRLKTGKWVRVVPAPVRDHPDYEQERFTEIERCPWCNRRLT